MSPSRPRAPLAPSALSPCGRAARLSVRAGWPTGGGRAPRPHRPHLLTLEPVQTLIELFACSLACVRIFTKKSDLSKSYDIGEALGSGNFATVHKAKTKEGRTWKKPDSTDEKIPEAVAVKIIDKSKVEDMGDIQREIEIMQMVSHPNVIQLYEIFDETKKMNLVMEVTRTTATAHATTAHASLSK